MVELGRLWPRYSGEVGSQMAKLESRFQRKLWSILVESLADVRPQIVGWKWSDFDPSRPSFGQIGPGVVQILAMSAELCPILEKLVVGRARGHECHAPHVAVQIQFNLRQRKREPKSERGAEPIVAGVGLRELGFRPESAPRRSRSLWSWAGPAPFRLNPSSAESGQVFGRPPLRIAGSFSRPPLSTS